MKKMKRNINISQTNKKNKVDMRDLALVLISKYQNLDTSSKSSDRGICCKIKMLSVKNPIIKMVSREISGFYTVSIIM
jgi:hypothetical protein